MGKIVIKSVSTNEKVFIEMSGGTNIHYTLDGSNPTPSSLKYSNRIDYPSKAIVKAKDFDDISGDISTYQCGTPMCWNAWSAIILKKCLIITEPLDFAGGNGFPLPDKVTFIGEGCIMNGNNIAIDGKTEFIPSVLTKDRFINCGDWKRFNWKKGQLINDEGVLKQWNGSIFVTGDKYDDTQIKNDIKLLKETLTDRPSVNGELGYEILKTNLTLSEQLNKTNTIYEIRNNFDLTSEKGTITIPKDCTLRFNGGSIKNGNIIFKNTLLEGDVKFIDITSPERQCTLANEDVYMDWFTKTSVAYAAYDTLYLKFFLYLGLDGKHHNIHIGKRTIVVKNCLIFDPNFVINNLTFIGDTVNSIIEVDKTINRTNWEEVLHIKGSSNIEFNGVKFVAPGMQSVENNPQFASTVLNLENCKNSKILNCIFDEMPYISPIMLTMPQDVTIKGNTFKEYDSGVILHNDGTRNETDVPESEDLITYRVEICNNVFTGEYTASEPITFKSNRIFDLRIHDNIIENKTQAAGISLKLPHSKSKCLISNNIIRNCDDGISIEFSRATFTITGNMFIKNGHNHIRIYDKANTIDIIGNIFKADGGTTMVVGTQTNVAESWVTCSNNIFEGCGTFKGNCNFVITHNTFTRNETANGYLLMAVSDITFVGNVSDRSKIIYRIEYQSPLSGKKKINIRDNNFDINLLYIQDTNIDESSFIELSRPIILWKGTELKYNLIQNKNSNTLYIIE